MANLNALKCCLKHQGPKDRSSRLKEPVLKARKAAHSSKGENGFFETP
jgi:hypothetical protein